MTYTDKNGTKLKVGNKLKNKDGMVSHIENICGVTMLVNKDDKGRRVKTTVFRKVDLSQMELVA